MKKSITRKIAMILCILLVFTSMQLYGVESTMAASVPWADSIIDMIENPGFNTTKDLYNNFTAQYPVAADWIEQDTESIDIKATDIFMGNSESIYKLASSVDESVSEGDAIADMINKYASAVEARSASRLSNLINTVSDQFVVVKQKQMGGSHYAYTEAVSDDKFGSPDGNEYNFSPGSEMVLLTLKNTDGRIERVEEVLLSSDNGVIRDPDVSEDGSTVLFSYKENDKDDFHLYEMKIATKEMRQLTNDPGVADIEPKYLDDGRIVFSSTRITQTVDCWITPVSNLFICDGDGNNIVRVGFDQVHTTYPTVTSDGRILYTRWDYNDRTQMFVQSLFQMNTDGTNQTELFANDMDFPTTLIHTSEIPGTVGQYYSVVIGHHTYQAGKLVKVDLSTGRNNPDSIEFVFPDRWSKKIDSIDAYGQEGPLYKYPYGINDNEFLVSYCESGYARDRRNTPFNIYFMTVGGERELLSTAKNGEIGASQIVPVKKRVLFERPNLADYSKETGTYYIGDIYEGDGLKGVERGEAKFLRIVALEYRTSAIGANQARGSGSADPFSPVSAGNGSWDVKHVLGLVPVYEDGSALFEVPARVPIYFQVLNEKGEMIQSMRSWSTLMPNENFSCVGCHEDKNSVPPIAAIPTMAMENGLSKIQPDFWQTGEDYEDFDPYKPYEQTQGFDYLTEVQPILDENCISCHTNKEQTIIGDRVEVDIKNLNKFMESNVEWKYSNSQEDGWETTGFNDSSWKTGKSPFGADGTPPGGKNTNWTENKLFMRRSFNVTQSQIDSNESYILNIAYDENPTIYINGEQVYKADGYTAEYVQANITNKMKKALKAGNNVIAVSAENTGGGQFVGFEIYSSDKASQTNDGPVSLESYPVHASREKRNYPLSYLVLTGTQWNGVGVQFLANSSNEYTNWISGMSVATALEPNKYGSSKSGLIERLRSGHGDLTDEEIRTIACWIDLGVPHIGTYDGNNAWGSNELREFEEKTNKRAYYKMADDMAVRALANGGEYPDSRELKIEYFRNDQLDKEITDNGLVKLVLDKEYKDGDKIKITLPEGEQYLYFNFDSRVKEALIYVPSGVFEYTITRDVLRSMPFTMSGGELVHDNPMISARIPMEEDLGEVQNIAVNPYDTGDNGTSFPHVTAGNTYNGGNNPEFNPRNAIDGFRNNLGHGQYPVQSWGPDQRANNADMWLNIDFGREVEVSEITITIRADFPHDTYLKGAVLEFSDGSTQGVTLEKTKEPQTIKIDNVKTSSIRIKDMDKAENTWVAISEVEVLGK